VRPDWLRRLVTSVAAAWLIGFAGCGGNDDGKAKRQSGQSTTPAAGNEAAKGDLAKGPKRKGEIVIRGNDAPRTYGPFTKSGTAYNVQFEQSKSSPISVAAEPRKVATSAAAVLQASGKRGQASAKVPWKRFYLWVPEAAPSYVLRLTPKD
jgi:hypothetical protein